MQTVSFIILAYAIVVLSMFFAALVILLAVINYSRGG